jgi:GAF domain-containing protein
MRAARPADEDARLAAVAALGWPAQARDAALDDIVTLAAERFGAPMAIISLTERERQTAIASCGAAIVSAPRDSTFCAHTVASGAILVVPDAVDDPRFATNPSY